MTIKPEEIITSLRRMADVETSVLYSQRTTLIGAADEIERLQAENATLRRQLAEARDKALDEAAASVEAVAHEGLHASMWRSKFERVAETIRLMKVEAP